MSLSVPGRGLERSCKKTEAEGGRNDSLQMFSKNEKTQDTKVNMQCLILVNATTLKCLYIETQELEEKKTQPFGREKRKAVFAHIEWMSLSIFWFSFEIDVGFVGMCEMNQSWFAGLPIMEG